MNEPRKQKSGLRLKVEDLEDRIAPTVVGAGDPVDSLSVDTSSHSVDINGSGNNGMPPPEVYVNGALVTPEA